MGQQFDRVAIALTPDGTEYVILESQVVIDFGQGQGPRGGVVSVKDGWVTIQGAGEARLDGGQEDQGGTFPPHLTLTGKGKLAVEIAAHDDPTGNPSKATVYLEGASATLRMRDAKGNEHTLLDGAAGNLWLGGKLADGDVVLFRTRESDNRNPAKATIHLDGGAGKITLRSSQHDDRVLIDGANGDVWLGGKNADGGLMLYHKNQQENRKFAKATIHLDGSAGQITMRNAAGQDRVFVDASNGDVWLGGKDASGDIMLFHKDEQNNHDSSNATIHLDGEAGDIVLRNADCAEDFDIAEDAAAEPGTVMVIHPDGRLRPSHEAYDRRVAGVLSGAGNLKPGIVLGRQQGSSARLPIALTGRVYCLAEASSAPIDAGDLLTTSNLSGFAMKALDPARAFGAVIGKALAPLASGQGLIPVLIALQ
jgi:hypothetical protein